MLAMDYRGPYRVRAVHKPDPQIEHPGDAIIRVTRSCICGSDLHLYHGLVPDSHERSHEHGHEHGHDHEREHGPRHSFAPQVRPKADMTHIQGWGADLDLENRPGVPMEHSPPRLEGAPIAPPSQQPERMEVFVSPERPHITPLFGTSAPPKGISGMLRRAAYKMTENDIRHFMLLLLADRINVVKGIGEDLMNGHVPNVLGEMGIKAEWEHNRVGLVKKAAVATAVVGLGYYLLTRRREER